MHVKIQWKPFLISVAVPLAVGGLSGWLTRDGMEAFQTLRQPALSPPAWLFPIVWTILFALMGVAYYLVASSSASEREKGEAKTVYAIQLAVNFLWPVFFFNLEWFLFSFFWLLLLWALVLTLFLRFYRISKPAGWMILPYLIWLTFAAYLNFGVYLLNR